MSSLFRLGSGVFAFLILLTYLLSGITTVEPGEVGLKIKMLGADRGVEKDTMSTGMHWVEPFTYDVAVYDTRIKKMEDGIRDITAATKDGQPVQVDVALEMGLDAQNVPVLHQKVGRDYYEQMIHPAARAIIREAAASEPSDNIYTADGRKAVQDRINAAFKERFLSDGVIIHTNVRKITFTNEDFVKSLEDKAKAAQKVIIAQRDAEAAAQRAVATANKAEGEKQKRIKEAEADAESKRLDGIGERQKLEQIAKGNLAIARAKAEGTRLQVLAYGSGKTYASVKWAENLAPKLKVYGVPTGAPGTSSLIDLNSVLKNMTTGQAAAPVKE